jgi:hypothetical protein
MVRGNPVDFSLDPEIALTSTGLDAVRPIAYWSRNALYGLITIAFGIATSSCGGGDSSAALPLTSPIPAPVDPPIVRIARTGVEPRQLIVAVGNRVTFVNNDSQPHDIHGGPDPATPDCYEIDAVGFLGPARAVRPRCYRWRAPATITITTTMPRFSLAV